MKINDVVKLTKVSARSIRYYEKMGLLKSKRTTNNYRTYSETDLVVIEKIQLFIMAGMPLKNIKYIVPCTLETEQVLMCKELEAMFFEEVDNLDKRIQSLKTSKKILLEIIKNRKIVED